MIDDCHATGVIGKTGRGTPEYRGVIGRVDAITGTFGKALGGASGGFTSGRKEIVEMLRQRSRPYLFGWSERRFHFRPQRDRRDAAPAQPALSVFQYAGARDCVRLIAGPATVDGIDAACGSPA